jgi:hypothetical protein
MKRIFSFGVGLLMFLSGVWHRCLDHTKCEEAPPTPGAAAC